MLSPLLSLPSHAQENLPMPRGFFQVAAGVGVEGGEPARPWGQGKGLQGASVS